MPKSKKQPSGRAWQTCVFPLTSVDLTGFVKFGCKVFRFDLAFTMRVGQGMRLPTQDRCPGFFDVHGTDNSAGNIEVPGNKPGCSARTQAIQNEEY